MRYHQGPYVPNSKYDGDWLVRSEPSLTPPDYDAPTCPECKSNNVSDGVCYDCGYMAPEPDVDDGTLWDMSRDFT